MYTCAYCKENSCKQENPENYPINCPSREKEEIEKIKEIYKEDDNEKFAKISAVVESSGYCKNTRLEEIIDFANRSDYKKLGIVFCIGLIREAKILSSVLKHNGFEVNSIVCKNGNIPKEFIKIKEEEKIHPNKYETMCNPIGQAVFLNKEKSDLNIILGLCVGHDSLFIKYSEAPVTVYATKDRVLGHNAMVALYQAESYYKKKLYK